MMIFAKYFLIVSPSVSTKSAFKRHMHIAFNVEEFVCGALFKVKTEPKVRSFQNCWTWTRQSALKRRHDRPQIENSRD